MKKRNLLLFIIVLMVSTFCFNAFSYTVDEKGVITFDSSFEHPKVSNAHWDKYTARWNCTGNVAHYQVSLYHNNVNIVEKSVNNCFCDFSAEIAAKGNYYFKVYAYNAKTGMSNSAQSESINVKKIKQNKNSNSKSSTNISPKSTIKNISPQAIRESFNVAVDVCKDLYNSVFGALKKAAPEEMKELENEMQNAIDKIDNELNND